MVNIIKIFRKVVAALAAEPQFWFCLRGGGKSFLAKQEKFIPMKHYIVIYS